MSKNSIINLLKKEEIIKYGNFKLRSGLNSNYYCDIKKALGKPKLLEIIVREISKLIPKETTCIAGSGYGGITLASLVSYKKKLPLILVRDKVKNHGTKKTIDGYIPNKKDFVCIVDDVFTTGSSISDTRQKLSPTKCKFVKPLVFLNRSKESGVTSVLQLDNLVNDWESNT